jgi:hypothetical protein
MDFLSTFRDADSQTIDETKRGMFTKAPSRALFSIYDGRRILADPWLGVPPFFFLYPSPS